MYDDPDDLPSDLRSRLEALGETPLEEFINKPIPALGGRSIIETLRADGGRDRVEEYLSRVEGRGWFESDYR
jgi:hypothetical protein